MRALTITYRQAQDAGACNISLRKMARHLGGIDSYGRGTPIPLTTVLDVLGLDDALWALGAAHPDVSRLVASDFAAHVHHIWEAQCPSDSRPADAIRASRTGDASARDAARASARDAAWASAQASAGDVAGDVARAAAWASAGASAGDVAGDVAWASARAAAGAGENEWQTDHIRAVLSGRKQPGKVRITRARKVAA